MDFAVLYIILHRCMVFLICFYKHCLGSIWADFIHRSFILLRNQYDLHNFSVSKSKQTKEKWFQKVADWLKLSNCYTSATGNLTIIFSVKQLHFFRVFSGTKWMVFDVIFKIESLNWNMKNTHIITISQFIFWETNSWKRLGQESQMGILSVH